MMKLKIFRYGSGSDEAGSTPHYDRFELDPSQGMTVLGALFFVQERLDGSLAFRYSCRGAVCGSCAMLINKVPRLACRSQLGHLLGGTETLKLKSYAAIVGGEQWDPKEEVLIEPLPHMPVLKDLVVDMKKFYEFYRSVSPVFRPAKASLEDRERERKMDPSDVAELEHYTNCILCAACYGACPVSGKAPGFIGPAALAKLFRFHMDPRESRDGFRLELMNSKNGWWGCEFHANCKRVCPKGVPPNLGIGKARQELKKMGKEPQG